MKKLLISSLVAASILSGLACAQDIEAGTYLPFNVQNSPFKQVTIDSQGDFLVNNTPVSMYNYNCVGNFSQTCQEFFSYNQHTYEVTYILPATQGVDTFLINGMRYLQPH